MVDEEWDEQGGMFVTWPGSDRAGNRRTALITCAPSSTRGEIELDRERRLAQIAADAVERPELARLESGGLSRRRCPDAPAARACGSRTFVVRFALELDRRPVDLLDAHRIRRRRIDHGALAAQHQRVAVIELRRPRFLVEQRDALRDLPPHLAHVAARGARRRSPCRPRRAAPSARLPPSRRSSASCSGPTAS